MTTKHEGDEVQAAPGALHPMHAFPTVGAPTMDARGAAASALKAFLACTVFYRDGGTEPPKRFGLEAFYESWPDPSKGLAYPSATITDVGQSVLLAHNFTPTMLDETADCYCPGTVLWKLDELEQEFQIDFFCNDEPTRQAIAAALPGAFSPDEDRSGVVVQGSPMYFDRPVRLTLLSYRRDDTAGAVFDLERRLICRVHADVDVVSLRKVAVFRPRIGVEVTTED